MKYSENALKIYEKLYYAKDETAPEQVHERVANFIGNNKKEKEQFKYILDEQIFRPNTPVLINAGLKGKNDWDKQLCACHVLGLEDSMDSIIDMWSTSSKIFASGAGIGIPITNLREKGAAISGGGTASGALAYLDVIEQVAQTVRSGGRARRSAIMGTFNYYHPEAMNIIKSKSSGDKLNSFNLSMSVDDLFMESVFNKDGQFTMVSPKYGVLKDNIINVMDIWNEVIEQAWLTGDPGLQFFDNTNKYNPFPSYGKIESTNPCGEVPLPPWSVCCLGSINLNKILTEDNTIDWKKFEEYIKLSVRFLDNVIDKTTYLHPAFKETMIKTRPIGLGIMGFSDILFKIGIGYNTEEARELFANICKKLTHIAINESVDLVTIDAENPIAIPKKDRVHFKKLLKHYTNGNTSILEDFEDWGIRNSTWTCIAPTGSISISADCSYAFEPCFALAFDKQIAETGEIMTFVNPIFEKELDFFVVDTYGELLARPKKFEILDDIKKNKGSIQTLDYLPKQMRNIFVTAHDISPLDKLEMQAAGQKYISLGISSTCNLPKSATKEDVSDIFIKAWQLGLKGITVYRDGCKEDQPIHFGEKECKEFKISPERYAILEAEFNRQKALEKEPIIQMYKAESKEQLKIEEKFIHGKMQRPIKRIGETCEVNTPHGRLFITGNRDESGRLFETFLRIGKQGSLNNLLIDALSRCMSKALQSGLTLDVFTDTLRGNKEIPFRFKLDENQEELFYAESLVDAIGIVFQEVFLKETTKSETGQILKQCPSCGKWGVDPSGCTRGGICIYCNYSNCI